jgi:Na+-driven multidrug efflux pump
MQIDIKVKADREMTKSELRKSIISFTWPCIAELMLVSLISIVNLSMVGHLGAYSVRGLTPHP